jgi:hypothetical protein
MGIGLAALYLDFSFVGLAVIIYAAGGGVSFVVRGTLPLALFGARNYGTMMGTLAFPSLMAQALAPWAATFVFTRYGSEYLLGMLLLFSSAHVATILCIISWRARRAEIQGGKPSTSEPRVLRHTSVRPQVRLGFATAIQLRARAFPVYADSAV